MGKSSSNHKEAIGLNTVSSSSPEEGDTVKMPDTGGLLVTMRMLATDVHPSAPERQCKEKNEIREAWYGRGLS